MTTRYITLKFPLGKGTEANINDVIFETEVLPFLDSIDEDYQMDDFDIDNHTVTVQTTDKNLILTYAFDVIDGREISL